MPSGQINSEAMSQARCPESCERVTVEGHVINLEKSEVRDSKTSISACSCGPECGPEKCDGRNRSILVGWDNLRTKIFVFLFVAFVVWLVIYVPVSLTVLETGNHSRKQEYASDEITLKDEILELKRQVMTLKRANEQYSVRLRKYEDEGKRKDKQLEQLMNPRKNSDVTKVLSTKGAAILMNLKDQNNALIQMLLNKNLHIRRLVAEVKMSKLYASTKKDECYKAEISRLRNLLTKSEEILRENIEMQQEQMQSICICENPTSESSSSSDQSSSRDLNELRYTILSLESHIKCSNDLLAQKNQEISLLSDELNFLKKYIRCKEHKSEEFDCDNSRPPQLPMKTFTRSWPDPLNSKKLSSQDFLHVFEKHPSSEYGPFPQSAPASSTIRVPSYSSTPGPGLPKCVNGDGSENSTAAAVVVRTDLEYSSVSKMGKSLLHSLAAEEILKAEKMLSRARKPLFTKGRWKQALTKYKELKKVNPRQITGSERNRKPISESVISSKFSDLETREFEIVENNEKRGTTSSVNEEMAFKVVGELKSEESQEKTERLEPINAHPAAFPTANNDMNDNDMTLETFESFENSLVSNKSGECSKGELYPNNESEFTDRKDGNVRLISSPRARREVKTSFQNGSGEFKQRERKSLREVYCQSLDSSFDSENSNSSKQDSRQVQVEVQINAISHQNRTDPLENCISESSKAFEFVEKGGNHSLDFNDDDDDDDVIVRQKNNGNLQEEWQ